MIYGIGDLHLSISTDKPMDIFGKQWKGHKDKIMTDWESIVEPNDLVLIAGDISWAMTIEEAYEDIYFIKSLPGKKLLIRGNHDFWWQSISKLRSKYQDERMIFLQNNSYLYEDIVICGSRGYMAADPFHFSKEDLKIYERELKRMELSLKNGKGYGKEIWVVMHYPPGNQEIFPSDFFDLFKEFDVKHVIYGHLHGEESFSWGPIGDIDGIVYHLVSADFLKFKLMKID